MTLANEAQENRKRRSDLPCLEECNEISNGDYILNVGSMSGGPTLRPGCELEEALCLRSDEDVPSDTTASQRLGIHIHAYYLPEFETILSHICDHINSCDLLVTTDSLSKQAAIDTMLEKATVKPWQGRRRFVRIVQNQGRNVIPLLNEGMEFLERCDIALHLHTKRSSHTDFGHDWLDYLLATLIGDNNHVKQIIFAFSCIDNLGMLLPRPSKFLAPRMNWGGNFDIASMIVNAIWPGQQLNIQAPLVFPPGMMFWFRPKALRPLAKSLPLLNPTPSEPLLEDGTPLHAVERLVVHSCELSESSWSLLPIRRGQNSGDFDIFSVSVWRPEPLIYNQCVAHLASQYRKASIKLEESEAAFRAIDRHRNELLLAISERDEALAEATSIVRKQEEELMQHDQALKSRDQALAEATAIVRRLESDLQISGKDLSTVEETLADMKSKLQTLETELLFRDQIIMNQSQELISKEHMLAAKEAQIEALEEKLELYDEITLSRNQDLIISERALEDAARLALDLQDHLFHHSRLYKLISRRIIMRRLGLGIGSLVKHFKAT